MDKAQSPQWGNAGPLGILATAVIVICLGSIRLGWIPLTSAPLMIGILLACAVPIIIAGIVAFMRQETLLGTTFTLFGGVVSIGAALTLYIQIFLPPAPGAFSPAVLGPFWITLAGITGILAIGFGRMSWFLMLGIALVACVFLTEGTFAMSGSGDIANLAGLLEIAFGGFCIYAGGTILLSEHFEKPVMPLGKPLFG